METKCSSLSNVISVAYGIRINHVRVFLLLLCDGVTLLKKNAEIYFAEHIKKYGGTILLPDRVLIKELTEKFGYEDRSILP